MSWLSVSELEYFLSVENIEISLYAQAWQSLLLLTQGNIYNRLRFLNKYLMFLEKLNKLFRENWSKFLTAGYLVFWKQFPAAGYLDTALKLRTQERFWQVLACHFDFMNGSKWHCHGYRIYICIVQEKNTFSVIMFYSLKRSIKTERTLTWSFLREKSVQLFCNYSDFQGNYKNYLETGH